MVCRDGYFSWYTVIKNFLKENYFARNELKRPRYTFDTNHGENQVLLESLFKTTWLKIMYILSPSLKQKEKYSGLHI